MSYSFFATAAKGTEPALRDELREIRVPGVRADRGGVHFSGELRDAYRVCLWSRVAIRVLLRMGEIHAPDGDALYEGVQTFPWDEHIDATRTLSVSAHARDSALTHTNFIAQRTKDAIVDQIRTRVGARPSVDREDADIQIFVHVLRDRASVYLDLVGESLHRRGYRAESREAPLKENLAAAMVRLSGWDRRKPFADPMCGSGTIAIEAAMYAAGIAPALARARFGFERWASFDDAARAHIADLRSEARARAEAPTKMPDIFAADIDPRSVALTTKNAQTAGVKLTTAVQSVFELGPVDPPGFIVTNPPYGVRISGGENFEEMLADLFSSLHGHTVSVLCATPDLENAMRARPTRRQPLFNGDIECRLINWLIP
ncbi:MAG: RNA methyltransferase [Sandaracinaceae bacterium]|nr:RNA methyltransferase [Sandaracinaceae bacterium]